MRNLNLFLGLSFVLIVSLPILFYSKQPQSSLLRLERTLTIHVIGDFGQLSPDWPYPTLPCKLVASSMNKYASVSPISMIVTTGDNFYLTSDNINLFSVANTIFTDIFNQEYLKDVPWYLSYGNHDMYYGKYLGRLLEELYPNVHMPSGSWSKLILMKG